MSDHSEELENYSYSFESVEGEDNDREGQSEMKSPLNTWADPTSSKSLKLSASVKQSRGSSVRFREVANAIQSMQSASQGFQTSKEIREQAHKEWLEHKDAIKHKEIEHRKTERRKEEPKNAEKKKRETENMQKSLERMKLWTARKKSSLQLKVKKENEEMKKQEQEEKKILEKLQEGKEAAEKWREEKLKEVVRAHRVEARKRQEMEKQKLEDAQQKEIDSKSAFKTWKKKKDGLRKERVKKVSNDEGLQENKDKIQESRQAVKQWLTVKNRELKENKTLFTYKDASIRRAHERAWRPAHSVQYSYPKEKLPCCKHSHPPSVVSTTAQSPNTTANSNAYSNESFESEEDERRDTPPSSICDSLEDKESVQDFSLPESSSDTDGSRIKIHAPLEGTGKLKSVQVCCQVVQYWCTCQDAHSINTTK